MTRVPASVFRSLSLAVLVLLTACAPRAGQAAALPPSDAANPAAIAPRPGGTVVGTLAVDGVNRSYRLHLPPGYRAANPAALVIALHGYSGTAAIQERTSGLSAKADSAGFVAVYPEGLGRPQSWKFGPGSEAAADVAFIRQLIDKLASSLSIDRKRIYVTGMSNGAIMSYRLACELSDTVAAIAPVSGGYPKFPACALTRPVPAVAFHGLSDTMLPYAGKPPALQPVHDWAAGWAEGNGCGATPAVTDLGGGVTRERWSACQAGADVALYTIAGAEHSWPGSAVRRNAPQSISATDTLWDFFAAHPMP